MTDIDVAREHRECGEWDAAYVLGALSPTDRRRYERHLETCERCREATGELSGLPGLLATVPAERLPTGHAAQEFPAEPVPAPPADLLPRLHAVAAARRRRRRGLTALGGLVAAAVVLLGVVLLWPGAAGSDRPAGNGSSVPSASQQAGADAVTIPLQPVVANPLAVDVTLVPQPWGTRIDLRCRFGGDGGAPGPDRDYGYALFVTNRAGATMAGPSWQYGPDTEAEPVGTSKWPVDQIAGIEVRGDDGTVLLRASR